MIPGLPIAVLFLVVGAEPVKIAVRITPPVIEMGALYGGAQVRIEGAVAPRSKVIIAITGSDREERFNRKARFGPVWMNAGKARISGAPSLLLRFSSAPLASLLSGDAAAALNLNEASVTARIRIDPVPPKGVGAADLRSAYVALKKSEGLYGFADSGILMDESRADYAAYKLQFGWPAKAPPGQYTVRVYEVRGGAMLGQVSIPLSVERAGFPAWLADLAENRASLYGLTAVLIGALAGFGIDLLTTRLFGSKHKAAH